MIPVKQRIEYIVNGWEEDTSGEKSTGIGNLFCIVIPPPNITGQLHMGHALDNTIQDILIRWREDAGLFHPLIPGTDHASIATEVRIVEDMAEEGLTKNDIGREGFIKRGLGMEGEVGGGIVDQLKEWAHPRIGPGNALPWTRDAAMRLRRPL